MRELEGAVLGEFSMEPRRRARFPIAAPADLQARRWRQRVPRARALSQACRSQRAQGRAQCVRPAGRAQVQDGQDAQFAGS
jgi:hypothetical protein